MGVQGWFFVFLGTPKWSLQESFVLTLSLAGGPDRPGGPSEALGSGLGVPGWGFRVEDSGLRVRVEGSGLRVQGWEFTVGGSALRVQG